MSYVKVFLNSPELLEVALVSGGPVEQICFVSLWSW